MKPHAWLILLPLAFPFPSAAAPQVPAVLESPLPNDPLKATIHRLSNGLTVYLSPNHEVPRISARIAVRAGGKHDPADSTGMAHYLEHMLFKGSEALGTSDFAKEKAHLDRILKLYEARFKSKDPAERAAIYKTIDAESVSAGLYAIPNELDKLYARAGFEGSNAHTSDEATVYEANFPKNRAELWARAEADRFARPVFRLFQSEIETVYEEKNRSMDNPERILSEAVERQLHKTHPYGQQTILGSIEHLKNPSLAKMYAFYRRHYVPDNMAVALSGDFERAEMLALVEKHLGSWKPAPLPKPKRWAATPPKGVERLELRYEAEEKVMVSWLTVPNRHADADALIVLDMLMDNAAAGIMNLELNQAQKVKGSGSFPRLRNDAGSWQMWAAPKEGQTPEQAEALLMEALDKLKAGEFTDEDIKAVVTDFEVQQKRRLESNDDRAEFMADSFTELRPWAESVGFLDRLRRVTKADVLRVSKYLGADRVVAIRRKGKPEIPKIEKPGFTEIPIDPSKESPLYRELAALPAAPIEPKWLVAGRDYATARLPSGKLYAAANPFNDLFALSYRYELGSRQLRGLCEALELLDLSGAGDLSAEELKKRLYRMGVSLDYGCGERSASVTLSGLERNLEPALALMRQRFSAPKPAPGTLSKMVEIAVGAHKDNKVNPKYVFHALSEYAQRGAASSVLAELKDSELRALKEGELIAMLKSLPKTQRRTSYVGSRSVESLAALLDSSDLTYLPAPERPALVYVKPAKDTLYFTHRDMVQAQVGFSAADGKFEPEKKVDYNFFSTYMDGGMGSVIWQEVRESRALAYASGGGYSNAQHKDDENRLWGVLGCQADKTAEAAELLRRLLRGMPASEERFRDAQNTMVEEQRTNRIGFREVPGILMTWEDQGLEGDPRPQRFEKTLRYTLPELVSFAGRFKDKPMTAAILGHRERVGLPALGKLGELKELKLEEIFPY